MTLLQNLNLTTNTAVRKVLLTQCVVQLILCSQEKELLYVDMVTSEKEQLLRLEVLEQSSLLRK